MGKLVLYGIEMSPPVRATVLTLKALNIPYEFKFVNLFEEHDKEEYRRINPTGTVPALDDNGQFISDSHAINAYLVSKYGKDDSFYPKDLVKRAAVDQLLHYDTGVVFERTLRYIARPIFLENKTNIPQYKIDMIVEVYETVNNFLKDKPYVVGNHLTIADFSLISSISTLQVYLVSDPIKYPNLVAWIKRLEQLPYYEEANGKPGKKAEEMIRAKNIKIVP
ncbi:glutathione S-transferase 1-like [Eurosta solidaginis]|uniref:glutathione S-transferase 1-like n=1 Tax=Eurosta solidaginis TaxID=178769 RepID=UPI0035306C69